MEIFKKTKKITEPLEEGINGQLLQTDGAGGRSWVSVDGFTVIDNLESSDSQASLSANQGRVLDEKIEQNTNDLSERIDGINFIDNLNSTDVTNGLSANQGRVLSEKIGDLQNLNTVVKNNLVAAINKINEKNVITAFNNDSTDNLYQSINVEQTFTPYPVILANSISTGNKLTLSDNKIVIGAGVSKILVSGMLTLSRGVTDWFVVMYIKKNDETIAYPSDNFTDWQPLSLVSNPILLEVQEGDVLSMEFATGNKTGEYQIRTGKHLTRMTVEVVE